MIALDRQVVSATGIINQDVFGFLKGLDACGHWQASLLTQGLKHHVVSQFAQMRTRGQRVMSGATGIQASFFSQKIYAIAIDWLDGICFLSFKDKVGATQYRLRSLAEPESDDYWQLLDWITRFESHAPIRFKRFHGCRQSRQLDVKAIRQAWSELVHPQQAGTLFKAHQHQLADLYHALSPEFAGQCDTGFLTQLLDTCRNERVNLELTARNACLTQTYTGRIRQCLQDDAHTVIRDKGFKLELSAMDQLSIWWLRIPQKNQDAYQVKVFNQLDQEVLSIASARPSPVWNRLF